MLVFDTLWPGVGSHGDDVVEASGLAAGAIGLSLAFLDPKMGPVQSAAILGLAWLALSGSLLASLASLLTSRKALRTGIEQVDSGRIRSEEVGGKWAGWTEKLNVWAAGLLVAGVVFLVLFAWLNIGRVNNGSETGTPKTPAASPTANAPSPVTQDSPQADIRAPGAGQGLPASAPSEVGTVK